MVSLLDIAPLQESVSVNGATVDVVGIGARGIVSLLQRFPALQKLTTGTFDATALWEAAPDAIAAIIAAGVGKIGDRETEESIDRLPLGAQMDLLVAIMKLTMPNGFGPFVDQFDRIVGAGVTARIQVNSSPKLSNS